MEIANVRDGAFYNAIEFQWGINTSSDDVVHIILALIGLSDSGLNQLNHSFHCPLQY